MADRIGDQIATLVRILHAAFGARNAAELRELTGELEAGVERFKAMQRRPVSLRSSVAPAPGIVSSDGDEPLHARLAGHIREAAEIRIASAFLSAADTNPLILPLDHATRHNGATVRILTSLMGFINRPEALSAFASWGEGLEVRIYTDDAAAGSDLLVPRPPAFHAKALLCEKPDGRHVVAVGSSNFTVAGLTSNVEWNYVSDFEVNAPLAGGATPYERAVNLFERTWSMHGFDPTPEFLARYAELYRRTEHARREMAIAVRRATGEDPADGNESALAVPRPPQQEALRRIGALRTAGVRRYAVIAATGLGKTYLSAFEVRNAGAKRALFLAHRVEILRQAMEAYGKVMPDVRPLLVQGSHTLSGLASGPVLVFAMVQTIGRPNNLAKLAPGAFDYVIVDEFHHAEAESYRRLLEHLRPAHLLGLTATPERADGQDVLRHCDRRVAYEVRLLDAVRRGWLAPFHYYALHDPTDYEPVRWTGTGYDEEELERALSRDTRVDLVVRNLERFQPAGGKRTCLAFCSNVGHAQWTARELRKRGVPAEPLTGGTPDEERRSILTRLSDPENELEVVCAVDVLNEGIDIPAVTHVLMLRPTMSFTVFLQQLGRGVRLHPGKPFLTVLDFVGNFRNNHVAPLALQGLTTLPSAPKDTRIPPEFSPPAGCLVSVQTGVREVWTDSMAALRRRATPLERLRSVLEELAEDEAGRPGQAASVRLPELFILAEAEQYAKILRNHGGWLRCRIELDLAGEYERSILGTPAEELLRHVEQDLRPNKRYKMVVLQSLLEMDREAGRARTEWTVDEIARRFLAYFLEDSTRETGWPALAQARGKAKSPLSQAKETVRKNPLHYLSNAPEKPFLLEDDRFILKPQYHEAWTDPRFTPLLSERVEYALARYWYSRGTSDPPRGAPN